MPSPERTAKSLPSPPASAQALKRLLDEETPAEAALVRRGEASAVARINHLKGTVATHERTIDLLTTSLSAQHELLFDVQGRVDALAKALPSPADEQSGPHQWEAVVAAIHQLQQRLNKGAQPSSKSPRSASSSTARPKASPRNPPGAMAIL